MNVRQNSDFDFCSYPIWIAGQFAPSPSPPHPSTFSLANPKKTPNTRKTYQRCCTAPENPGILETSTSAFNQMTSCMLP
ncbi:hypothetical protein Y032_0147g2570 [Ancylostoma ceylanicum]|uniref:Uncharacterized protein n=1 Tax=Ancylostoma ceylanicum TaxID=53326 RepID=A0A016T253_9BILA|nr:hypothetical protein Y032_0147g2570 [Ancylostoma ceylanicum]